MRGGPRLTCAEALADDLESVKQCCLELVQFMADTAQMKWPSCRVFLISLLVCFGRPGMALASEARPALWKLSDTDTTIYLFGTIHLMPDGVNWRTPVFDKAANSADTLVLEVGNLGDAAAMSQTFMALATSRGLAPVKQRVTLMRRDALMRLTKAVGTTEAYLDQLENWAVASTLEVGVLRSIGLSADNGVETVLRQMFEAGRKPVLGIETAEDQLRAFDSLSDKAQLALLNSILDEGADPRADFEKMLAAWGRGDDKAIAKSFDAELKSNPEIGMRLIKGRNANWVRWIEARMDRPGTVFIAVGAGHLAGRDSVQRMLGNVGLKVSRIQ
jgi:uncharacterized protein